MNIYCSSDGTIFHVDTERIYQGSAGVNKVRFIGQFPSNAQVLVSYKLPNGVLKGPKILTPIATLEEVKTANGGIFSVWETVIGATPRLGTDKKPLTEIDDKGNVKTVYDLDYTITENYGVVEMQFFVYPAGETLTIDQQIYNVYGGCLATASTTFTVEKGVPMQAPRIEEFTTTDGEQLLSEILNIVSSGIAFSEEIKSSATPFLLSKLDKDGEQRAGVVLGEEYEENEQKKYKAAVESETVSIQAYEVKENGEKETKAQVSVNDKGEVNFYGDNFFVNGEEINFKDGETALSKAKDNELLIKGLGDKYVALQSPPAYARSYYYRTIRENGQVKNDILQGSPMNFAHSLVERDVNGRAKVNDPEDEDDIVNKRTMKREVAPIEEKLKQVKFAFSFNSYDDVVTKFNAYNKDDDTFHIGQDVFVRTQNVPDLWISGISDTKNTYNYTNDAAFVEEITNNGIIQIGYVVFSALESKTMLENGGGGVGGVGDSDLKEIIEAVNMALEEIIAIQNALIGTPFEELHEYAQSLKDGGEV